MKYSLRSLMIVVTVLPPLAGALWLLYPRFLFPMYRDVYRYRNLGDWVVDLVIVGWCGVVFTASALAYRQKRKPAMLVAAILAIVALLGWVGVDFILFDIASR